MNKREREENSSLSILCKSHSIIMYNCTFADLQTNIGLEFQDQFIFAAKNCRFKIEQNRND